MQLELLSNCKYFLDKIVQFQNSEYSNEATDVLETFLNTKEIPDDGFELKELSNEDDLKLVKNLKEKKSCRLDWICGFSLKIVAKDLIPEIGELINLTIRNGRFTPKWKVAKMMPAFKN